MVRARVADRVMIFRLSSCLSIESAPPDFLAGLKAALTFPNLQFTVNEKAGRSNWNVPRNIVGYSETEFGLIVPRGFIAEAIRTARAAGLAFTLDDRRRKLPEVDFQFAGAVRPIQRAAVDDVLKKDFGVLNAATGSGKTVMALAAVAARRQPTLVIVHNKELLNQWIERIGRFLAIPAPEVGIIGGGKNKIGERITVAIVNSLYKNAAAVRERVGFVITDECFASETKIDTVDGQKNIEDIKTGDIVLGYNHDSKQVVESKVLHEFHNQSNDLYRIDFENGEHVICTANHPFYIDNEYKPANEIKIGDYAWRIHDKKKLQRMRNGKKRYRAFLQAMPTRKNAIENEDCNCSVPSMRKTGGMQRRKSLEKFLDASKIRACYVLGRMHERNSASWPCRFRNVTSKIQSNARSHQQDIKQPNEKSKMDRKDDGHENEKRNIICRHEESRRKWPAGSYRSKDFSRCLEMANGSSDKNGESSSERKPERISFGAEFADVLQNRHSKYKINDRYRSRRTKPQWETTNSGFKENGILTKVRVESVKVYKPPDTERSSDVCPVGPVFNLETETGNYFAGGVLVHNCHRCPSRTFTEAVSKFDAWYSLGLSATPWRRDGQTKLIFWHLGDLVHSIDKGELESNGDILRAEIVRRETGWQPNYARMIGELTEDEQRNKLIVADVCEELEASAGICLILSDRKEHCDTLAGLFAERRIWADVLTGALGKRERLAVVGRAASGAARVVIATGQLIGEGFDCAGLSTLFLATPIKFDGRLLQYLGRVLRPAPGKEAARVYDYRDSKVGVLCASARSRDKVYEEMTEPML